MNAYEGLEDALSLERFGRYLDWSGGDRTAAIELYTLNSQLSESLYIALQALEVSLRNRIHKVMTDQYGEHWFDQPQVLANPSQSEQLERAKLELTTANKSLEPGRVVAALSFSFWTAFFGTSYEDLWQERLHAIAIRPDGKGLTRKDFSRPLTPIRLLRNRVAHHEPIINRNLRKHYENMHALTSYLSQPAAAWVAAHCRFDSIYASAKIDLKDS